MNGNSQSATIQHVAVTIEFSQFNGNQDQKDELVENTQAVESVIRDADMASLMVKHANDNILVKVG